MSIPNPTHLLTVEQALKLLGEFSCTETKSVDSAAEKAQLRQALLLITRLSDYQNLGVCADTVQQGLLALETYLKALGYNFPLDTTGVNASIAPVYIKFNTLKGSYYLDTYTGKYRGVLVSCQSSESEAINGTYGHFPLDLFSAEEK